ncbi:MAG: hypothetical protein OEM00_09165, partial [Burkholderiaceae bacterium]|nr:hypothetical protein [Burkholderiaceae bacterium]
TLDRHGERMEEVPMAVPALLHAQLLAMHGADLAIVAGQGSDALWTEAQPAFAPLITLVHGAAASIPLLERRNVGEAYLCRHGSCEPPAQSVEALRQQLARWHSDLTGKFTARGGAA